MTGRILILDDEVDELAGLEELLREEGFDILMMSSPFELPFAIRSFEPDLILIDLAMPALRGETILKKLPRDLIPDTGLLLFSGASEAELQALVIALDADGYISKGEDLNQVIDRIVRAARWHGLHRAAVRA